MKILASAALAAVAAAMALGAFADTPQTAAAGAAPPKPRPSCFWASRIDNFAAVDDENLYLRVGSRDVYRLKLFSSCFDIAWVHHIALRSRSSSLICEGSGLDVDVLIHDVAAGRQRCPVTDVRKLTPEEVAALPKGARP